MGYFLFSSNFLKKLVIVLVFSIQTKNREFFPGFGIPADSFKAIMKMTRKIPWIKEIFIVFICFLCKKASSKMHFLLYNKN